MPDAGISSTQFSRTVAGESQEAVPAAEKSELFFSNGETPKGLMENEKTSFHSLVRQKRSGVASRIAFFQVGVKKAIVFAAGDAVFVKSQMFIPELYRSCRNHENHHSGTRYLFKTRIAGQTLWEVAGLPCLSKIPC